MTKSYCLAKVANASIFSAGIIFPDGLDGVLIIITLVLSYLLKIDKIEFIIIIIVIGLVLVSEIINTAIERLVDLVSPKYNKLAGEVKDIAASSVLLMCIFSLIVGVIIFVPKIINLLGGF